MRAWAHVWVRNTPGNRLLWCPGCVQGVPLLPSVLQLQWDDLDMVWNQLSDLLRQNITPQPSAASQSASVLGCQPGQASRTHHVPCIAYDEVCEVLVCLQVAQYLAPKQLITPQPPLSVVEPSVARPAAPITAH
jgi:hypothetical protein